MTASEEVMSATSPRSLPAWFAKRALHSKSDPALTFEGRTSAYGELHDRSSRLAGALQRGGVKKGDRVGYLGFNSPDVLVVLLAATSLGAIFLPLNYRLTPAELQYIIRDADIHTLIVASDHLALIEPLRESRSVECRAFVHLGEARAGWSPFDDLLAGEPLVSTTAVEAADVATIVYTSGTTGRPKGAMLSHSNLWANNLNWILAFGTDPSSDAHDVNVERERPISPSGRSQGARRSRARHRQPIDAACDVEIVQDGKGIGTVMEAFSLDAVTGGFLHDDIELTADPG